MKEELTFRERVMLALDHKETDRVPFSWGFGVNQPACEQLCGRLHMGMAELDSLLMGFSDVRWYAPTYVGPAHRNRVQLDGVTTDIWGVGRKPVSYGTGEYDEIVAYPLSGVTDVSELGRYEWPSPDWFDVSLQAESIGAIRGAKDVAIILGNGNIFESSWYMRGFERMLMDLVLEPELAWEIMTRVTDYFIGYFRKVLAAASGSIDIVFTADDIGQQEGLLLSLDLWETMIKPHHVRLNKALHEFGVKIMYHTDGAVMPAVPGLIDMGIDVLEALQFDAKGMDPNELKGKYGDRLCFHGGVSVQKTLPFGSPDDVREETKERIRVLGKGGGYILAPSHAIQAGTPPGNILAFLEASGQALPDGAYR